MEDREIADHRRRGSHGHASSRLRSNPIPAVLFDMRCPSFLVALVTIPLLGPSAVTAAPSPGREMADAANHFQASLTPERKAKATYEFKDDERFDWHFIPKPRKGLPFKEMTPPQRLLAH